MAQRYTAGQVVLEVKGDFSRVTPQARREFAGLGPFSVPVTVDARGIEGVRTALRSLPHIVLDADSTPADRELMALRARLQELNGKTIGVDISAGQARAELASIQGGLDRLGASSPDIAVRVDTAAASAALDGVSREIAQIDGRTARAGVHVDVGTALSGLASVAVALGVLDGRNIGIGINLNAASAIAGLAMTAAKVTSLIGIIGGLAGAAGGAAGALGGLGAAGAVAGAGAVSAALAFLGVGKALQAMSAQQESAGTTAAASAKQQQAAAQAVESAQDRAAQASVASSQARSDAAKAVASAEKASAERIAQAQQQAAKAVASAEKQAVAAHRALRQATADLAREQRTLTTAWEQGRRSLQDLQDQVDGNALDQRQAAYDLADARAALVEAQASGDPNAIGRAQLAVDRQIESMDQLGKQTQRLGQDNAAAQRAGVAGSAQVVAANDSIAAAQQRVSEAALAARDADVAVSTARIEGAQAVTAAQQQGAEQIASAREQGARQIAAADQQVIEAQKALTQALTQTGDAGDAAGQKVAAAFANLSPAAAAFARYLFGLKPILEGLSATAATAFFPPLMAGMNALLGVLPQININVGKLAGAMGVGLQLVLTQLASPFWLGFFTMLADASGAVIPALFQTLMNVAGALAILVTHLMPLIPSSLALFDQFAGLVAILAPFIAQMLGGLIPVFGMFLQALVPLGPLMGALTPILTVLGQAFSMILGAVLTALTPVIIALTPLIQQLAMSFAVNLVGAIQAATPFLVQLATWMSQNPGLIVGIVTALTGLFGAFQLISGVVGALTGPLVFLRLAMMATGASAATLLSPFTALAAWVTRITGAVAGSMSSWTLFRTALSAIGAVMLPLLQTLGALFIKILLGTSPLGMLIRIFTVLFTTNEQFRGAVMNLLNVFGQLIGQVVSSLMPVFTALTPVLNTAGSVFGALATGLATALVPIINALAAVLEWLSPIIGPLVAGFLAVKGAVIAWSIAQWALNVALNANPIGLIILAIAALVGGVVWAYQNLGWFRDAVNAVGAAFQWVGGAIATAWNWIGSLLTSVWTGIIQPVFTWFGGVLDRLGFLFNILWVAVIQPAWTALGEGLAAVYNATIKPVFDWFQFVLGKVGEFFTWVFQTLIAPAWEQFATGLGVIYHSVVEPVWNFFMTGVRNLGDWFVWVFDTLIMPAWDRVTNALAFLYHTIVEPVWNAFTGALDWLGGVFDHIIRGIGDGWNWLVGLIKTVWDNTLGPIFSAIGDGLGAVGDAASWLFTGSTGAPAPPPGRAQGGLVAGYARGGLAGFAAGGSSSRRPTPGPTDIVPSLLTPGEWVMTRGATTAAGPAVMAQLMAMLEANPGLGRVLAQMLASIGGGRTGTTSLLGGTGAAAVGGAALGFARGGLVPGYAEGGAVAPAAGAGAAAGAAPTVLDAAGLDAARVATDALTVSTQALTAAVSAATTAWTTYAATGLVPATAALVVLASTGVVPLRTALVSLVAGGVVPAQVALVNLVAIGLVPTNTYLVGVLFPTLAAFSVATGITAVANLTLLQQSLIATQMQLTTTGNVTVAQTAAMTSAIANMSANGQGQLGALQNALRVTGQVAAELAGFWNTQMQAIQRAAADPIRWIMQFPLGPPGIAASWNTLDDQFKLGKRINPPAPNFATGGIYPGYTPGRDIGYAHVSGGEAIMRPEWTRVVGPSYVAEANQAARSGGAAGVSSFLNSATTDPATEGRTKLGLMARFPLDGPVLGSFAPGGVAPHVARASDEVERLFGRMPGGVGGVGSRANKSDHPAGLALDFMTLNNVDLGHRVAGHLQQNSARMAVKYLIFRRQINSGSGWRGMEDRGSATANHMDHVHASFTGDGRGGPMAGGGGFFDPTPIVEGAFAKTYQLLNDMPRLFGDSSFVMGGQSIARQAADGVKGKALEQLMATLGGLGPLGAGAPFYVGEISRAAKVRGMGVDGATIGVATALVESGLKMYANRAVPASLGLPHDAVGSDHDSVGLFQQRQAGWGTLEQRMNPFASAGLFFDKLGSFNWRGMDPGAAAQRVQVSAFPGRYSGQMGQARSLVGLHGGAFDLGGLAEGRGIMIKDVIAPERVLDPVETRDYDTLGPLVQEMEAGRLPAAPAGLSNQTIAAMTPETPATGDSGLRDLYLYDVDNQLVGRMKAEAADMTAAGLREFASARRSGRKGT